MKKISSIGLLIKQDKVVKDEEELRMVLDFNKLPIGTVMDWYDWSAQYGYDDDDYLWNYVIQYKKIENFSDSDLESHKNRPDMYEPMLAFNKEIPIGAMDSQVDFEAWCERNNFDTETLEEYGVIAFAKFRNFTDSDIEDAKN